MDKAKGGTTDLLLEAMRTKGYAYGDFVRIVELENEMSVEFLKLKLLPHSPHLRVVNNYDTRTIKKIAFCSGSGSDFIKDTPCDAFVTGDLKYHTAVESQKVIFDIGHFESEIFVVDFLRKLTGLEEKGIIADETSPFI
jgi:putative NIF3 family GTP cyclohydrolase 1 type 2